MNDLDDVMGFIIIVVILGFFMFLGGLVGSLARTNSILSNYCESQSAQYEVVDDVDYCLKDNQLTQIEWMK